MAGINVEMSSAVEVKPGESLQASEVREWIAHVPNGATITAVTRQMGHQRDPYDVLVGLTAKWSEVRHAQNGEG